MTKRRRKSPRIARWLLHRLHDYQDKYRIVGDLEEAFQETAVSDGFWRAYFWYWMQTLNAANIYLGYFFRRSAAMSLNYVKTAMRNMTKHKSYSFINIFGFASGISACFLILLFIRSELSYDTFHKNSDRIHRVVFRAILNKENINAALIANPAGPHLQQDFPEVLEAVRFVDYARDIQVAYENQRFYEPGFYFADENTFDVFSFPLAHGNPKTALKEPFSVVINEELADKYFGDDNPMGKMITVGDGEGKITGVMKNVPKNSHFHPRIFVSMSTLAARNPRELEMWLNINAFTYLLLEEGVEPKALEEKLPAFVEKYMGAQLKSFGAHVELVLQPLTSIHLHSNLSREHEANADIGYLYILGATAAFIMLVACINFINLSTARSMGRAKEVGIRKVVGANRPALIKQFLGEAAIMSTIAFLFSMIAVKFILPLFARITDYELVESLYTNAKVFGLLFGISILAGVLSGFYPALFLSSFRPVQVLRGKLRMGARGSMMRNGLVIAQFTIAIILITSTWIVQDQVYFLRNKRLGFDKENILVVPMREGLIRQQLNTVREKLTQINGVKNISAATYVPGVNYVVEKFIPEGYQDNEMRGVLTMVGDHDLLKTLDVAILQGRDFSRTYATDVTNAVIINETAQRELGLQQPIGKTITFVPTNQDRERVELTVIGVAKDFHFRPLTEAILPMFIYIFPQDYNHLFIKMHPGDVASTIRQIAIEWEAINPGSAFEYSFLDKTLDNLYDSEQRLGTIINLFTIFAFFIACLGLLGLISFAVEQRTGEISVRKVLGASGSSIILLFAKDYLKLVIVSTLVAAPCAYFAMNSWLNNFAYQTELNNAVFILAGAAAGTVAFLVIGFQVMKTAFTVSIDSLKQE